MSETLEHRLYPAPKNAIVILLDSLNRHMLGGYGGTEFDTPNLDAFAKRSLVFEKHYAGSLPCIPARHDLLCGALASPRRPWGSIEIWKQALTALLRKGGCPPQMVADHPPLFETGGENCRADFNAWRYERGHESDPWKTRPDDSWIGAPMFPERFMPYDNSRGYFREEHEFPGAKTMAATAEWLDENAGYHDRFFLFVDEFDPHEPFDTPEPYASMYDGSWEGPHLIWPPYIKGALERGVLTARQTHQLRACYGGKLTMIDSWFGKVMEAIERNGLWEDTAVIVCTDHGHYLGEKDIWGKPGVPAYEPLGHIPLMISWPGVKPGTVSALTTTSDIFATLVDLFGVEAKHRTQGSSLLPLIHGEAKSYQRLRPVRRLGARGAPARRSLQVLASACGLKRADLNVVQPLVDDADPVTPGPSPTRAGQPRVPGQDARLRGARDPAAVPRGRPVALLGDRPLLRQPPVRPAGRPQRGREPPRLIGREGAGRQAASGAARSGSARRPASQVGDGVGLLS